MTEDNREPSGELSRGEEAGPAAPAGEPAPAPPAADQASPAAAEQASPTPDQAEAEWSAPDPAAGWTAQPAAPAADWTAAPAEPAAPAAAAAASGPADPAADWAAAPAEPATPGADWAAAPAEPAAPAADWAAAPAEPTAPAADWAAAPAEPADPAADWAAAPAEPATPAVASAAPAPTDPAAEPAAPAAEWAGRPAEDSDAWWSARPAGEPAADAPEPAGWPAQPAAEPTVPPVAQPNQPGEQVLFGSAFQNPGGYPAMGPPATIRVGPNQPPRVPEQRRGSSGLVAGVAVLALVLGGGAGALGGYLVADANRSSAPVENALDDPKPAEEASTAPAGSVEAVAAKMLPSVVQLRVQGRSSAGEGSGFTISSDGLIVTNNHVVEAAAETGRIEAVFQDGTTATAKIVGRDPTSDVAVVKAEGQSGLPVVELGSSDALKVGQGVVAIGSPFELSGTVTSGIVSALHRPTRAGGEDGSQATVMDAIQTDAAINPGNSGGPLVNTQGQVIGINSAIYSPNGTGSLGIGFAIPIDQARRTAQEIVDTGKATQTVLGVTVRNAPDGGAQIVDVVAGGAGEKAGLVKGDVVTKLDDRNIDSSDALVAAVRSHKPGDKVRLELRNGSRTVEATLAGQIVEPE